MTFRRSTRLISHRRFSTEGFFASATCGVVWGEQATQRRTNGPYRDGLERVKRDFSSSFFSFSSLNGCPGDRRNSEGPGWVPLCQHHCPERCRNPCEEWRRGPLGIFPCWPSKALSFVAIPETHAYLFIGLVSSGEAVTLLQPARSLTLK